jgi:hypothetical protein
VGLRREECFKVIQVAGERTDVQADRTERLHPRAAQP